MLSSILIGILNHHFLSCHGSELVAMETSSPISFLDPSLTFSSQIYYNEFTGCKVKKAYTPVWLLMHRCICIEMSHNAYTDGWWSTHCGSLHICMSSQQWYLVYALWQDIPKLVYTFLTLQPVNWIIKLWEHFLVTMATVVNETRPKGETLCIISWQLGWK